MSSLPAYFDLSTRVALVIGGTKAAVDRARLLQETGASIRLVAATLTPEIEELVRERRIDWRRRPLSPLDLYDVALAFVATGSRHDDEQAARAARAARVPVSVFDRPDLSDFFVPSVQAGVVHRRRFDEFGALGLAAPPAARWHAS